MDARRKEAEAMTKHPNVQQLQHLKPDLLTYIIAESGLLSRTHGWSLHVKRCHSCHVWKGRLRMVHR